jgi:flavin reductase (NADH)
MIEIEQPVHALFRHLTSPVVALTCAWKGKLNGMILNSAVRASLDPAKPRVAVFILKRNLSHDLVFQAGAFALHLLHIDNWDLIWELGFHSGREREKLSRFSCRTGATGSPLLEDSYARFDCRVINAMDAGASTCFMGEAIEVERGRGEAVMTSEYFREHMPADWRPIYEANLKAAQQWSSGRADDIRPLTWKGLRSEG